MTQYQSAVSPKSKHTTGEMSMGKDESSPQTKSPRSATAALPPNVSVSCSATVHQPKDIGYACLNTIRRQVRSSPCHWLRTICHVIVPVRVQTSCREFMVTHAQRIMLWAKQNNANSIEYPFYTYSRPFCGTAVLPVVTELSPN